MTSPLRVLAFLATATIATAGEYFRFDAPTGPGQRSGTLHGYAFHERDETLRVIDLVEAKAPHMGDAFATLGANAGCNGGVTLPDGQPLGLMIAQSEKTGTLVPDTPQGSGLLRVQGGLISLLRSATATPDQWEHAEQALQAGPLLVENHVATPGLDADSFSRRTVLVTSGTGEWAILYVPSATLDGLARMLADGKSFPRFRVATALHLSSGAASGIWLHRPNNAPPLYLREIVTGRNALAVMPR
jgi:hypothetical protein